MTIWTLCSQLAYQKLLKFNRMFTLSPWAQADPGYSQALRFGRREAGPDYAAQYGLSPHRLPPESALCASQATLRQQLSLDCQVGGWMRQVGCVASSGCEVSHDP